MSSDYTQPWLSDEARIPGDSSTVPFGNTGKRSKPDQLVEKGIGQSLIRISFANVNTNSRIKGSPVVSAVVFSVEDESLNLSKAPEDKSFGPCFLTVLSPALSDFAAPHEVFINDGAA